MTAGEVYPNTCGDARSCVWRASQALAHRGHNRTPFDLCIAIASDSNPCGARAVRHLGTYVDEDGNLFPGQPFCPTHYRAVTAPTEPEPDPPAAQEYEPDGWVYFARRGTQIKIGYSTQPERRLRSLQTTIGGEFDDVHLLRGTLITEKELHYRFAAVRDVGEWFTVTKEMVDFITESAKPFQLSNRQSPKLRTSNSRTYV